FKRFLRRSRGRVDIPMQDGVTECSRRHWGAVRTRRLDVNIASANMLAEMARIKCETSKLPGNRDWRELYRLVDRAYERSVTFDESKHPREPAGSSEGGQFTSGDGGGETAEKPATEKPAKKKTEIADFTKSKVRLDDDTRTDQKKQEKFLQRWNDAV